MAGEPDAAPEEPKTVKFKLFLDCEVIDVKYKDKDDLFKSLKKKLDEMGIPITSVYSSDNNQQPLQLKDADAVALAAGNYQQPLFARLNDDARDERCAGDEHHKKPHHPHGQRSHRRRSTSSESSKSPARSPGRGPHRSGSHDHHGFPHHSPHRSGSHERHHAPHPPVPPYPGGFWGHSGCPVMGSGFMFCPFLYNVHHPSHGFGYGHGHGHDFGNWGHCPAFRPGGHCPAFGPNPHGYGFGHGHGHNFGYWGHCPALRAVGRCPAFSPNLHSHGFGHDHGHGHNFGNWGHCPAFRSGGHCPAFGPNPHGHGFGHGQE